MPLNTLPLNPDFDSLKRYPFYFGSPEKPLLGWLHTTNAKQHFDTGIIICPPLAVEYMNSYRSLRYVADYFALAGIPALRFDYHGTGDSSGIEEDDNRLKSWLWSIEQAQQQLQTLTNCNKSGLFGFRIGATLAALSTQTQPSEFLVCWAALNNGKKYIREIKLIQKTGNIQSHTDDTLLQAGGMGYWEQTAKDISEINLAKITPKAKNILVIPRDEQITDSELFDSWSKKGINVSQENYTGSTLMLVDSHLTKVPHETILNIIQWVEQKISPVKVNNNIATLISRAAKETIVQHTQVLSTGTRGNTFPTLESIHYFGENKHRFGILTETETSRKSALPTIIIANSGANHRVGPSRLYVLLARELSLQGFKCLRIDVPGIGDSIISDEHLENDEYIDSSNHEIYDAIKSLDDDYKNKAYILMGLCSGAYFSFQAALNLQQLNITECILINPLTFYWDNDSSEQNSPTKDFRVWSWYKEALTSRESWLKLIRGKIEFGFLFAAIKNRLISKLKLSAANKSDTHRLRLAGDLKTITDNNTHIHFLLSRSDPGYDILMSNAAKTVKKLKKLKRIDFQFVENADHTFSKYKPRRDAINNIIQYLKKFSIDKNES